MIGKLGAVSLYQALMVFLAGAVIVFNACESEAKSLKSGEVYQTLDGKDSLRVVSKDEMEDKDGFVARYTVEGDKVRVVVTRLGMTKAHYYTITRDGLVEDKSGGILYSEAGLAKAKEAKAKQKAAARARGEEARKGAMVSIKGGCFEMGDTFGDGGADEKPVHRVCLDDFRMDKYEVTQAAYQAAMGNNPSGHENCPNCPVEEVNWAEAKSYCGKVGKRLPTEAEWEYAAREGGKQVKYGPGGNEVNCSTANFNDCVGKTAPVGSHAPNALGLHDMAGNVWEWTADWYDDYKNSPERNPKGPSSGTARVLRGGSWLKDAVITRASSRDGIDPGRHLRLSLLPVI